MSAGNRPANKWLSCSLLFSGVTLSSILPPQKMMLWGWRVPLLLGCVILPFLFRLRRSLQETHEFIARKHRPGISEILRFLTANW
jgi:hypothetical protein